VRHIRPVFETLIEQFQFAGEASRLVMIGLLFWLLAGLAAFMDRRRARRRKLAAVGWMPWNALFLASAMIGFGLIAIALPVLLRG
jgi:hypothetical protein